MGRRTAVALVACVSWAVASGAGAQTTTSSTSTSTTSTSTSSTSTTSTSTTSTTVVNPCTGQPCTAQPPVATLSGSGGDVRLDPFEYCWRAIAGDVTQCAAATLALDIPVRLVIRNGETLSLAFAAAIRPTDVVLQRGDQPGVTRSALTPANPTVFVADLPVGIYLISFQTKWNQGNVAYLLKVDVRAQPRPLALTG